MARPTSGADRVHPRDHARMTASTRDARAATAVSVFGTLADGVVGSADPTGLVRLETAGIEIEWWIGADDGWKIPGGGDVHTVRPGLAPAIDARVRVPGGEVVLRAYGVAASGVPLVVADVENASPAAAVVAWVVRAAPGYRVGRVAIEGSTVLIDERARIELPGAPSRWAVDARTVGVHDSVVEGRAASGRFEPVATRRGDLEIALLFPVAHRTRTRIAATTATASSVAVARLPSLADVERGWATALERGMQVELPDATMQASVDAARATLLLGTVGSARRDRVVVAEAAAWGLTGARFGRASALDSTVDPWPRLRATVDGLGSSPRRAAQWLRAVRGALVCVNRDGIAMLAHFPVEWLGLPVAVHGMTTRHGPVSFALRWHGARPALLWDAPERVRVRAPSLDPSWEAIGSGGEALLAEIDRTRLLPLGTAARSKPGSETAGRPGVTTDEPGSFT
jgi:hypothetical protein